MTKKTFNREEVIELIRFYCEHQRILCQLPTCSANDRFVTKEENERICKAIRVDANIERLGPLEKENFERILKSIQKVS